MQPEDHQPVHAATVTAPAHAQPAPHPHADTSWYTSNPFLISAKGLVMVLQNNAVPALVAAFALLGVFFALGLINGLLSAGGSSVGMILFFVAMLVMVPFSIGVYIAIAASSSRNEKITLGQAFSRAASKLFPLMLLLLIQVLAITIGLILLVIPGLIMLSRLALASIVMFEENLGPLAALTRSSELTKGHFWEMLSAQMAGGLMASNGLLSPAASIAPLVGRYNELKKLHESGAPAPKRHWLNIALPLVVLVIVGAYVAVLAVATRNGVRNRARLHDLYYPNGTFQLNTNPSSSNPYYNNSYTPPAYDIN